jgi:hypothetical protein
MTKFSRLSRFGMTYKPLTETRGEELLTLYLAGFPAKTSAQPAKAQELKETNPQCGNTWHGLLARLDPDTLLWRTAQCSLLEDLELSLQTFPKWGLMQNGALYPQQTLVRRTSESVFGFSLPTPVSSDATSGAVIGKNDTFYTTSTGMPRKVNQNGKDGSVGLGRLVQMWPTPAARDYKGANGYKTTQEKILEGKRSHMGQLPNAVMMEEQSAIGGTLNPTWVEWLMAWPLGWTDLNPLEMDKCLYVQQLHGSYSNE